MDDDVREFENNYEDFGSNSEFIEYNNSNLPEIFWREKLKQFIFCQLKIIEKHYRKDSKKDVSVYTGSSGLSCLYILLEEILDEGKTTSYIEKALDLIKPCLGKLRGDRLSFLCGDAGFLAIGAVIYHKLNMKKECDGLIEKLIKFKDKINDLESSLPDEVLYGRAGYLFSLLFIKQYVNDHPQLQPVVKQVVEVIIESGKRLSKQEKWKCPLMYKWHDKHYFGAAHGISGILFMLLQVSETLSHEEKFNLIKPTIDYLIKLRFLSGNYPSSYGSRSDRLVHWCHGAPGFIHLFIVAYKVYQDELYLNEALSCGEVIWKRGLLKKGYGICHGVSGNALGFLQLFRLTGDRKHLYRATKFAQWCLDFEQRSCRVPDRPMSLFEGQAGTIWFIVSMLKPESAKFPAFQLY